jgi:single-stranded-DNA-specific exonuclease
MVDGLRRCAGHLEKFGGHEFAGGLSVKTEKIEPFTDAFEGVAREWLRADDLLPLLEIDAPLSLRDIGFSLLRELEALKPFGIGNPEPLFMTSGLEVCERKPFPAGARYRFRQGERAIGGVAFGVGEDFPGAPGTKVDVAYRLSENEWNGSSSVEMKIVDARRALQI